MWRRSASSNRPRMASATTSRARRRFRPKPCLSTRAQLLTLTVPEMTVLVGGMRVLNANFRTSPRASSHAAGGAEPTTSREPLDMRTEWNAVSDAKDVFEGRDRTTGQVKWTGTRVDLIFGSHSQLRALAEVYASADASTKLSKTSWRRGTR